MPRRYANKSSIVCGNALVTICLSLARDGVYGPFEIGLGELPEKDPTQIPEERRLWPSGAGEFEFRSWGVSPDLEGR